MIRSWRWYLQRVPIPQTTHELLHEKPTLKLSAADKRVFLSPKQAKLIRKPKQDDADGVKSNSPTPRFDMFVNDEISIDGVDSLRPDTPSLSPGQFDNLVKQLTALFTANQLRSYASKFIATRAKDNKLHLATAIIRDGWNVQNNGTTTLDDFTTEKRIKLDLWHLHLLIRNRDIVKNLSATGVGIKFNLSLSEIKFKGTRRQVDSADVLLQHTLSSALNRKVRWGHLEANTSLDDVAANTDVYLNKTATGVEMTSLNKKQLDLAQRLLIWQQAKSIKQKFTRELVVLLPTALLCKLPFRSDALDWMHRNHNLWCTKSTIPMSPSLIVDAALENLTKATAEGDLSMKEIDNSKKPTTIPNFASQAQRVLGLIQLTKPPVAEIWDKLGVSTDGIVTVTMGTMAVDDNGDVCFDTNAPLVCDKAMLRPLWEQPDDLTNQEPCNHHIQLHFVPLPWNDNQVAQNFPPVVLTGMVSDSMRLEVDTIDLVAVEAENSVYVSLPENKADLKVCFQLLKSLLQESEPEEENPTPVSIDDILSTNTRGYHLRSQPGLNKFLEKSKLNLSLPVDVYHTLMVTMPDGSVAEYKYVLMEVRRLTEFDYNGLVLQHTLVEGGRLGGRRNEIVVADDVAMDFDKFEELVTNTHTFVTQL